MVSNQFYILGEAIIQGFYVTESGVASEDVGSEKTHFQLAKALSVMKIKASTFYSHFNSGDHEKVKELLDDALKDRMKQWTAEGLGIEEQQLSKKEQKELKSSNTKLNKAEDIQVIHEAFQYLMQKYVNDAQEKDNAYISINKIHSYQKRLKKMEGDGNSDNESHSSGSSRSNSRSTSRSNSRRNSISQPRSRRGSLLVVPKTSSSRSRSPSGSRYI